MGNARTVTAATIISNVAYELRDKAAEQYTYSTDHDELFVYLNKCLELIYMVLTEEMSPLVATGSGSITLVDGTETYTLADNSMGDMWVMGKITGGKYDGEYDIYLTDASANIYKPLKMVAYGDRYQYVQSGTSSEARPTGFYFTSSKIGFLPVPDAAYTCTIGRYIPNFTTLATSAATMPHKNLFNLQVEEGIKLIAKNRNAQGGGIESALMDIFQRRALEIARQIEKVDMAIKPRFK